MRKVKIEVTEEDILNGEPGNCIHCPIALAAKRTLKSNEVWVFPEEVSVGDFLIDLPEDARRFLKRFDEGREVRPFSFTVNVLN